MNISIKMGLHKFGRYLDSKNSVVTVDHGVSKKYITDCLIEINEERTKQTDSILAYQTQMSEIQKQHIITLIKDLEERIIKLITNLETRLNNSEIKNKTHYDTGITSSVKFN